MTLDNNGSYKRLYTISLEKSLVTHLIKIKFSEEVSDIRREFFNDHIVEFLNIKQHSFIICCHKVDCNSFPSKPSTSSNTMEIILRLSWGVVAAGIALAAWVISKLRGSAESNSSSTTVVIAAGVAFAAWVISKLRGSAESNRSVVASNSSSSTVVVAAGIAFAAWGISKLMDDSAESNKKMMKKPGADGYMQRRNFEESPKTYFRNLRGKE